MDRGARESNNYITKYFQQFLGVIPKETDSDLTKKAMSAAHKWATSNKGFIDPKQEVSNYKNRARVYLLNHDTFDTNEFIEAVIQDQDTSRRKLLKESFLAFLQEKGIAGQSFTPKKQILNFANSKNIRRTAEGVKIEWEGVARDRNIEIPNKRDSNGMYEIKIRTSNIEEIQ